MSTSEKGGTCSYCQGFFSVLRKHVKFCPSNPAQSVQPVISRGLQSTASRKNVEEECNYCGNSFRALSKHIPECSKNPANKALVSHDAPSHSHSAAVGVAITGNKMCKYCHFAFARLHRHEEQCSQNPINFSQDPDGDIDSPNNESVSLNDHQKALLNFIERAKDAEENADLATFLSSATSVLNASSGTLKVNEESEIAQLGAMLVDPPDSEASDHHDQNVAMSSEEHLDEKHVAVDDNMGVDDDKTDDDDASGNESIAGGSGSPVLGIY